MPTPEKPVNGTATQVREDLLRVDCPCGRIHEISPIEGKEGEFVVKTSNPEPEKKGSRFFKGK